jgi:chorismate mutase
MSSVEPNLGPAESVPAEPVPAESRNPGIPVQASNGPAPRLLGLRGATTFDVDEADHVAARTIDLLKQMMGRNGLDEDDIVSILFTATADLTSVFPATAAREIGFADVPLICAQELAIAGSKERCIRILMHISTVRARRDLNHVYLEGAADLRDDVGD